jgi:hypothetical protein
MKKQQQYTALPVDNSTVRSKQKQTGKENRGWRLCTGKKKKEQMLLPGSPATDHRPSHPSVSRH